MDDGRVTEALSEPLLGPRTSGEEHIQSPPVQEVQAEPGGGSKFSAYLNLTNCLVGSGLLALPSAFASSGIVGGVVGLVLIALCNMWSCRVLVLVQRNFPEVQRYDDVGALAFGHKGRAFSHLVLCASQLGFVASYIVFTAENFVDILRDPLGKGGGTIKLEDPSGGLAAPHAFHAGELQVTVLVAVLGGLLAFIRRMETLASLSGFAIYCIVGAVTSLMYDGFKYGLALHSPFDSELYGPPIRLRTFPAFFGIATFSYCCQGPVLALANSIRAAAPPEGGPGVGGGVAATGGGGEGEVEDGEGEAARRRADAKADACMSVVAWSMVTVTVVYSLFGGLGYMFFTSAVREDVVENLKEGPLAVAVKLALSIVCLLSVPVQLFPVVELVENMAVERGFLEAPGGGADMWGPGYWRANLLRAAAVALPACIAMCLPCFGQVTDLVGAVCSSAVGCVFPPICYVVIERRRAGGVPARDALCCGAVAMVGVLGGALCTAQTVKALAEGQCD